MINLPEIETERLIIRAFRMEDLPDIYERVSNAEVTQYTGGMLTYQEAKEALIQKVLCQDIASPFGNRAVVLKSNNRNIGYCGLNPLSWLEAKPIEISYGLTRAYWDCGFATEAAAAMLECAFRIVRLPEIVAAIHPLNARSIRVARKLHLKFHSEMDWPKQGRVNLYRLTRKDYERDLWDFSSFRRERGQLRPRSFQSSHLPKTSSEPEAERA
jgi:[ribosomal protein S5]-alanine N-acetyltransferase